MSNDLLIRPSDRIYIAGHRGMAGSAICRALSTSGYKNQLKATRQEVDLTEPSAVDSWFRDKKPDVVVLAAAKVGGILANNNFPADFILDNLKIQNNVIEAAWRHGARRLLFLGSSCIYPKFAEQPIKEKSLLTGTLEPTNEWYAIAKIAGIQLCRALRLQHNFDAISLMPTNLYGPGDNYHPSHSHVMAALIRRFTEAVHNGMDEVTCWGTGSPRREFLHVDDLASAAVFCLETWRYSTENDEATFLNIGTGTDLSIKELAELIATATGFKGSIKWDTSKPDGTPRKLLDISLAKNLGWQPAISLETGIKSTIDDYLSTIGIQ
jgi:GDP-L-fucose synthase